MSIFIVTMHFISLCKCILFITFVKNKLNELVPSLLKKSLVEPVTLRLTYSL